MHGKQTGPRLGTRPSAYYDVTGIYRHIPPGHANKCSLRLSRRARDTAATMLHHSRHRGESATKTTKFFVAHTVNYVICNNHTGIEWVLLNFTPVIQQNYHQPGRKFEELFCAVDRLSCQLELSKSETSQVQKRSCF